MYFRKLFIHNIFGSGGSLESTLSVRPSVQTLFQNFTTTKDCVVRMHSEDYLSEKRSLNLKINVIIVSEKLMIRMIERSLRMIIKPFVTKSINIIAIFQNM